MEIIKKDIPVFDKEVSMHRIAKGVLIHHIYCATLPYYIRKQIMEDGAFKVWFDEDKWVLLRIHVNYSKEYTMHPPIDLIENDFEGSIAFLDNSHNLNHMRYAKFVDVYQEAWSHDGLASGLHMSYNETLEYMIKNGKYGFRNKPDHIFYNSPI